jgi:hypothetical protein
MVFGVRSPVDFREEYFSAVLAAAHDFACLRINRPVAGKTPYDGRKTSYRLAGLTPSPDGIRTRWTTTSRFRKDAPPFIPAKRQCSVALRESDGLHTTRRSGIRGGVYIAEAGLRKHPDGMFPPRHSDRSPGKKCSRVR